MFSGLRLAKGLQFYTCHSRFISHGQLRSFPPGKYSCDRVALSSSVILTPNFGGISAVVAPGSNAFPRPWDVLRAQACSRGPDVCLTRRTKNLLCLYHPESTELKRGKGRGWGRVLLPIRGFQPAPCRFWALRLNRSAAARHPLTYVFVTREH